MSGGEGGVVDFGKLFTETNEQKFSLGGVLQQFSVIYDKIGLLTELQAFNITG